MAVNFGLINQGPTFAESFIAGQEAVRAEADRNLLRQAQMEQMAAQRENMLAQRQEREAQAAARRAQEARAAQRQRLLTGAADALRQGGHTLNRDTLQQILASAIETDEPTLFQFATQTLKALDEEDLYKREAARFGLPGGAPAAPAAPSVMRQPAAAMPAAPAAPANLLAGTPYDIGMGMPAPTNALAAPPPAPAAPTFTREQVQAMLTSPSARIREQGKALVATLEKPQVRTIDTGAEILTEEYNPSTGVTRVLSRQKKTMTPGEAKPIVSNIDVGGAILTQEFDPVTRTTRVIGRQAKTLTPEQMRVMDQEKNVVAHTTTDETGKVTLYNKFGQVVTPTGPAGAPTELRGKPSATFEKTTQQRKQLSQDLNTAIFELKEAVKPGGLIEQSTGSGTGQLADIAARSVGVALEGDIAIGKLKPIADIVLKMVPRFEGPQSDKDTQSYKEAAGQLADPGMPRKIRMEAAKTIIRLMENRKGQFVSTDMAAQGTTAGGGVDTSNPLLK